MMTGLRPETFDNLQLNAGVFLFNFDVSAFAGAAALEDGVLAALEAGTDILGATVGDGTFSATPTIRQMEANGMRYPIIGSTVNDLWTIKMTGTAKEVTPDNFQKMLISCDKDTSKEHVTVLTVRTDIEKTDYIPKLCWVGDTSKGFVLIELDNVLNIAGATFTFTDRNEGTLPFEFQAHVAHLSEMANAPFRIYFFDEE